MSEMFGERENSIPEEVPFVSAPLDLRSESIAYLGATLQTIEDDPSLQAATELRPEEIRGRIVKQYRTILDTLDETVPVEKQATVRAYILDRIKVQQESILAEHADEESK